MTRLEALSALMNAERYGHLWIQCVICHKSKPRGERVRVAGMGLCRVISWLRADEYLIEVPVEKFREALKRGCPGHE